MYISKFEIIKNSVRGIDLPPVIIDFYHDSETNYHDSEIVDVHKLESAISEVLESGQYARQVSFFTNHFSVELYFHSLTIAICKDYVETVLSEVVVNKLVDWEIIGATNGILLRLEYALN